MAKVTDWLVAHYEEFDNLQWRAKELIQYCEAYDMLLGAGVSRDEEIERRLCRLASNLYYFADCASVHTPHLRKNNHRLMVAAALGIAACTLNSYGTDRSEDSESTEEGKRNVRSFQPYHWAGFAMTQTEYVLKNVQTDPTDRVYSEGPYYFRYAMMHLLPFFKAAKNFNGDWTESYRGTNGQYYNVRSPWYDSEYDRIMNWITKIKMPDGRIPAYADTYNDSYFPCLAIKGGYYSWPVKAMDNLTGESNPTEEELQAAILNWQLTFASLDNRVDYICAGNSFQQVPGDWSRLQAFPTGGDVVLRNGWGSEDLYLYINAHDAPDLENDPGYEFNGFSFPGHTWGHRQDDQTSFLLNWKGKTWLLDAGYLKYEMRDLVRKSFNHNTIQVNNNGPLLKATNTTVNKTFSSDYFQYARISAAYGDLDGNYQSSGLGNVTVTREFLLTDNHYVLVHDKINNPYGNSRNYSLLLHGNGKASENTFEQTSTGGIWRDGNNKLTASIFSLQPLSLDYPVDNPVGINNHDDGYDQLRTHSVVRANVSAVATAFVSVLYPSAQNDPPNVEQASTSNYIALFVDSRSETNRYEMIFTREGGTSLSFAQRSFAGGSVTIRSIETDANLLVMSFDANSPDTPEAIRVFAKGITYLTYDNDIYFYPKQTDVTTEFVINRHMKSKTPTATAYNNGRRMVAVTDDTHKRYCLVYESNGNIYGTYSEEGISWDREQLLSTGTNNKYPSITGPIERTYDVGDGTMTDYLVFSVWQHRLDTGNYEINFAKGVLTDTDRDGRYFLDYGASSTIPYLTGTTDPMPVATLHYILMTDMGYTADRLLLCARTNDGISYVYSDDEGVSWSSPDKLPSTNFSHKNPSLSLDPAYSMGSYPSYDPVCITYDDGNSVYFNRYDYYGWGSPYNVSSGTGLTENQYASVERDGNGNVHVAWQGKSNALMAQGIAYRKRYANGDWIPSFSFFYQTYNEYHQPSVTGHAGEKCSIVWHNNGNKIMKVRYNGTSWELPPQIVDNGKYPNLSIGSISANYCWTRGTTSPYEIKVSSQTLERLLLLAGSGAIEGQASAEQFLSWEHSRCAVLYDTLTNAVFWTQIGEAKVKTKTGQEIVLPLVSFVDSLLVVTPENHLDYLRTEMATLPLDVDSLKFDILVYSRGSEAFKATDLEVEYKVVDTNSGLPLVSIARVPVAEKAGQFRSHRKIAIDMKQYRGRKVFVVVEVRGLKRANPHLLCTLGDIYLIAEGSSFGKGPKVREQAQTLPTNFALYQSYPNPFNPETAISYALPQAGRVTIKIYNPLGQEVITLEDEFQEAGYYTVRWDGKNNAGLKVGSGVYFYRLKVDDKYQKINKMLLLR